METSFIGEKSLPAFERYLRDGEKSEATVEKYLRDTRHFFHYLSGRQADKAETIAYKHFLIEKYAPASVNSMLTALNCYLRFAGLEKCCVKLLKIQRQVFCMEEKELTKAEYQRLVCAAGQTTLFYLIQTICGTGIRVSELQYVTVEAVKDGRAVANCKNKTRVILFPAAVRKMLTAYIKKTGRKTGPIFIGKTGKPLDRSGIWRRMKQLCGKADVAPGKVFPHNLRHLFARTFYSVEKDIVRLADLLGHCSINTTRIYTLETGIRHIGCLERVAAFLAT